MVEKEDVFSSKVKYDGYFKFSDFYKFCYEWLADEEGFEMEESKYVEKVKGNSKEMEIEWNGKKKITDYFRYAIKVKFRIIGLTEVEINKGGVKVKTNKGSVEISMKGTVERDYKGKFETSAAKKMWRGIYEKFVIPSRIDQIEDKLIGICDEFLSQAKAYLDLEGKK
jgi:hypothetical protein